MLYPARGQSGKTNCPVSPVEDRSQPVTYTDRELLRHEKTNGFLKLLERQAAGEESVIDDIFPLEITLDDGKLLFYLHSEWKLAFSYYPVGHDALRLILAVARWLVDTEEQRSQRTAPPEWAELRKMRGPVETVWIRKCNDCNFDSAEMVWCSGFYQAAGFVCNKCRNVYIKSEYDDSESPTCSCGGRFQEPELQCRFENHKIETWHISPYKYFESHSYIRGYGA